MEESLFPRGKVKYEPTTQPKKRTHRGETEETLFSEGNKSSELFGRKRSKSHTSENNDVPEAHGIKDVEKFMDEQETVKVDFLHCKRVQDSTLLLGCIREIHELQLVISLPHCNTGYVQANQISETYTSEIRKHIEMESENLTPLADMFHIGDIVICSVLSPVGTAKLQLTILPSVVNRYLTVDNFFAGQMISGAVKSREDHGYTIDIGKNNIKAFLPLSEVDGGNLLEGTVIRSVVTTVRGDGSILLLSMKEKKIIKSMAKQDQGLALDDLQPGTIGMFLPLKKMKAGVVGKFLGFNASICVLDCDMSEIHLKDENFDTGKKKKQKKKDIKKSEDTTIVSNKKKDVVDRRIKGCVLFVNPITKRVALSSSTFLLSKEFRQTTLETNNSAFPCGQKCEATIMHSIRGLGAVLKLSDNDGTLAFSPSKHLSDEKLNDFTQIFSKGSSYPARVLQSMSLDGAVVLSLKKSIVESEYLSYDNISPGSQIDCVISTVFDNGLLVTLGKKEFCPIKGFVSKIHMADVVLQHPEKIFTKGDVITCMVLRVDKVGERVQLTHKKTLLNSKFPVITSFEQLQPGCITHGYIASIKPYGVFVNFYNNIHGLVNLSQLSTSFIEDPEKTYFVGQVMKCRVLSCDPSEERAKLSFILKPKLVDQRKLQQLISQELVSVEVVEKSNTHLNVIICDDTKAKNRLSKGVITMMHLSDFPSLAKAWFEFLTPGCILTNCCVFENKKQIMLSRKSSVTEIYKKRAEQLDGEDKSGTGTLEFSDLKEGLVANGIISHIVEYGVFVQFPGGLVGLSPMSRMTDRFLSSTDGCYEEGQSVIAKVIEIDSEKRRFIVNLKLSDCPARKRATILSEYIKESTDLLSLINPSWPEDLSTGKAVQVTLMEESNTEKGFPCYSPVFPEDFNAFVTDVEKASDSKKINATLLYVDFASKVIILSANSKYSTQSKKPKVGRVLTGCKIENINEDVSTVIHSKGNDSCIAMTLTRSHPNQSTSENFWPWKLNDNVDFTTMKPVSGTFAVSHVSTSDMSSSFSGKRIRQDSECSEVSLQGDVKFGNMQVGQEIEGTIKSIKKDSLLVRFTESEGGFQGNPVTARLHISEMGDDLPQGVFSMKKYHVGEKIKCKVAGFRDVKSRKFLAITNRNARRCIPELSLRNSPLDLQVENINVGQEVEAIFTEYVAAKDEIHAVLTPTLKAFLPVLLLSDNPEKSLQSIHNCKKPVIWHCVVQAKFRFTLGLAGKGAIVDRSTAEDITELKNNCVTNGRIRKIFPLNAVVSLPKGGVGKVHITDSSDNYSVLDFQNWKVGDIIRCGVVSCKDSKSLVLSTRQSHILPEDESINIEDNEILEAKELTAGSLIRGFVTNISKSGVFIALSRSLTGRADITKASKYYIHDIEIVQEIFKEGRLVTCKILNVSQMEGKVSLSLLESDTGVPDIVPEKLGFPLRHGKPPEEKKKMVGLLVDKVEGRKNKKRQLEKKKRDAVKKPKTKEDNEDKDSGLDEDLSMESQPKYMKIVTEDSNSTEDPGFSWETSNNDTSSKEFEDSGDSSGDDEIQEKEKEEPKKSRKEVELKKIREEHELRRKEDQLLEDNMPQSALEWDKLVLANPQNSMLWVSFMAFHLRATEVEKARGVAEQAIKIIDFREEKEKWNVWAALLNLENRFGTKASLSKTIERACQHNDPLKVNSHMVSIFERSDKNDEAEELCGKMVRKFRRNKAVWMIYISHLMQKNEGVKANEIFKRSLQSLDKNCHLEIITKFAQLEYKTGDSEKGRVLFENALSNYPKRADIWSVYIDMLVKVGKLEEAREIFERVTTLNFSTKNMRTFFKRFIEFESKYGSDESVAEVKQKALEYIESKTDDVME